MYTGGSSDVAPLAFPDTADEQINCCMVGGDTSFAELGKCIAFSIRKRPASLSKNSGLKSTMPTELRLIGILPSYSSTKRLTARSNSNLIDVRADCPMAFIVQLRKNTAKATQSLGLFEKGFK